ncbi:hypothetical protein AGMMS50262_12670 [Bacteroidia bacterium]|nr:hypothetical protein AGMMS50262_12670 [Bacteroidia bacterium]
MYFYPSGNEQPIYGQAIGTKEISPVNKKEVAFDGDPLTLYNSLTHDGGWVGMDFGKPVKINKISYTPRGDGNDITPGDMHELLYWNNKWISMGKQKATDIKLTYDHVPAGTLYWVRNLSRGTNERIFSYENGTLVWW